MNTLLRLQADCNSSDPLPGLPSRGQVGGPGLGASVLADWSAFVRLSQEKQALAEGLGGGVNTIPFVLAAVSCEEKEANKALLSAWEGRLLIVVSLTQRGNSAHLGHPAHTHS